MYLISGFADDMTHKYSLITSLTHHSLVNRCDMRRQNRRQVCDLLFSFLWTQISWLSLRNVFKWEKDTAQARRNLPLLSKAMTMWTTTLGSHSQLVLSTIFSRRATMPNMSVPVLQVSIILHAFFHSLSFILISLLLEFLAAKTLELAGNAACDNKKQHIVPHHSVLHLNFCHRRRAKEKKGKSEASTCTLLYL